MQLAFDAPASAADGADAVSAADAVAAAGQVDTNGPINAKPCSLLTLFS